MSLGKFLTCAATLEPIFLLISSIEIPSVISCLESGDFFEYIKIHFSYNVKRFADIKT